jgi:hypothetical protein
MGPECGEREAQPARDLGHGASRDASDGDQAAPRPATGCAAAAAHTGWWRRRTPPPCRPRPAAPARSVPIPAGPAASPRGLTRVRGGGLPLPGNDRLALRSARRREPEEMPDLGSRRAQEAGRQFATPATSSELRRLAAPPSSHVVLPARGGFGRKPHRFLAGDCKARISPSCQFPAAWILRLALAVFGHLLRQASPAWDSPAFC